jgi:hypothetical protein
MRFNAGLGSKNKETADESSREVVRENYGGLSSDGVPGVVSETHVEEEDYFSSERDRYCYRV